MRQVFEEVALRLHAGRRLPLVERIALNVEELLQALADVVEGIVEIEVAVVLAQFVAQLFEEVVEAEDAHAVPFRALAHQPLERLLHVIGVGEILGEFLEHLVGIQPHALRAVPLRIAGGDHG